jgi:hypothetical protein
MVCVRKTHYTMRCIAASTIGRALDLSALAATSSSAFDPGLISAQYRGCKHKNYSYSRTK